MSTFITTLDSSGVGPRVAVKDLLDVEGVPTTAGCHAIAKTAEPAAKDAACLTGIRAAGARIVGKANLHELAMLPIGSNPWFGTPVNPLDPALIPGGSSSGSAVAVANGDADVALGTDTGGSVRVPSACCGTAGLKTTHGRIPVEGCWPLAPGLDTIGPMAVDMAGVLLGMQLLEPGFTAGTAARVVGRVRTTGDPVIEGAVDEALRAAGFEVVTIEWDELDPGAQAFPAVYFEEMCAVDEALVLANPEDVGDDITMMVGAAGMFLPGVDEARRALAGWRTQLAALFERVEVLALPTMPTFPPRLDEITPESLLTQTISITSHVAVFNAASLPATAQPIPVTGQRLPASLQLVGPMGGEELLVPTAQLVEDALA